MDLKTHLKNILRMCGHAMVSTIHERLDRIEARSNEVEASLLQASIHTIETLREMNHAVVAESSDGRVYTAELALMEFLYSHLPSRTAVDIAANEGDLSKALLDTGFEVYAFEADAARFDRLERRLGGRYGFHLFRAAVGNVAPREESREERAHHTAVHPDMAIQVQATRAITESRTTLERLCRERVLPEDVSLMCIESGESCLEVIRGMGACAYPVVVATYSGSDGGRPVSNVEALVAEIKKRGYPWHIVLYRVEDRGRVAFFSNYSHTIPNSSGHVFFFRDHNAFARAQEWCSAICPATYFKPGRAMPKDVNGPDRLPT